MGFKANLHLISYFHPIESYCESDFLLEWAVDGGYGGLMISRLPRVERSLGMSKVLPKVWGSQEHFRAKCSPLIQRSWKNTRKLLVNCIKEVSPKSGWFVPCLMSKSMKPMISRFAEKVRCAGLQMKGPYGICRLLGRSGDGTPILENCVKWECLRWEWQNFKPTPTQQEIRGLNKSCIQGTTAMVVVDSSSHGSQFSDQFLSGVGWGKRR